MLGWVIGKGNDDGRGCGIVRPRRGWRGDGDGLRGHLLLRVRCCVPWVRDGVTFRVIGVDICCRGCIAVLLGRWLAW